MRPSNGARIDFFAMVAWRFRTVAWACFARASAASRSAGAFAPPARSLRVRSRLTRASVASAVAAASCASSAEVSSFTRSAPRFTDVPDSNAISRTVPGSSAAIVTPCTATIDAIAALDDSHSVSSARADETASGGGAIDSAARTMVRIWLALTPTRVPRTRRRPTPNTTHCFLLFAIAASAAPRINATAACGPQRLGLRPGWGGTGARATPGGAHASAQSARRLAPAEQARMRSSSASSNGFAR